MDDHSCEYYRTGELSAEADADYVVAECDVCGSRIMFEASAEDYAQVLVSA